MLFEQRIWKVRNYLAGDCEVTGKGLRVKQPPEKRLDKFFG